MVILIILITLTGSQNINSKPVLSASSGNLLKLHILRPQPGPAESDTLGVGPAICVLKSPPGDSDTCSSLRTTALENSLLHDILEN